MRTVNPPTLKELITLRVMILFGSVYMFFFIKDLVNSRMISFAPLFWMLIFVLIFNCLQVLHEWVHYLFITVPPTPAATRTYTVDIFTTFCAGEPYEMIVETLTAIQAINYPHNTYLCDEANDPYLKKVCDDLGVHHVTRTLKIDAKAGNINNALRQSSAELCVVLDPDHVPYPDFLDPIVSHFDNPEIGFVQIVQSYKNYRGKLIAKGAAQQTFQFYGPIMMTMNKYGTVLAIGANCTFRRTALESIGGHAAGLAEDMHTAMQLHARGWKSVYVPAVLAKGLVPDTLSAYYSQQLKWSRGVFELLVTSYPKLFKNFTWRQKLHYAVIPMHYFSGVVFLINFLIPIISLLFNVSPINVDVERFAIMGFPLALSIFAVRHYVQAWVMEDEERGFHLVGGLLMIGTWWVFILGFVYTLLRKKVPYVPTPKDDQEESNWILNVPNIAIILLSLVAVFYGLSYDWSPYTLIMSAFAISNCFVLLFTVVASRQQQFRRMKSRYRLVKTLFDPISFVKNRFWKTRHLIYRRGKGLMLPSSIFIACFFLYEAKGWNKENWRFMELIKSRPALQAGIFAPNPENGRNSVGKVEEIQSEMNERFSVVSLYLAWGDKPECFLPKLQIDSIYKNASIPMITWEPWQNLFEKNTSPTEAFKDDKVFSRIVKGDYDHYLHRFSSQIKALKRPIYLRFAHEADNPGYPWSQTGMNSPEEFKEAWRYVHNYFLKRKINNVIWVWNPWKPEAVNAYFPGKEYVDWLGVTILNYGSENKNQTSYSMEALYSPFHDKSIFRSGIPVMIAEMGSMASSAEQRQWFEQASKAIEVRFPEIKSVVFFYSGIDKNTINEQRAPYNWTFDDPKQVGSFFNFVRSANAVAPLNFLQKELQVNHSSERKSLFKNIRGVNYNKGKNWLTNYHGFTRKELAADFTEMKARGFTTIKWYGPSIYDRNILTEARRSKIDIMYSFWVPQDPKLFSGTRQKEKLSERIIDAVKTLKANGDIISWHIGNDVANTASERLHKPDLLFYQNSYYEWLSMLIARIKEVDPTRRITLDLKITPDCITRLKLLQENVSGIDSYGLIIDKNSDPEIIKKLKVNYFYSSVEADEYLMQRDFSNGVFIANWQDEETKTYVTFNGLKDRTGRNKRGLYELGNLWKGLSVPESFPSIKILLPAVATLSDTELKYHAIIQKNGRWSIADHSNFNFQWALVRNDRFGNHLEMNIVGEGPSISLKIPENPHRHKLYLFAQRNKDVEIIETRLNTPLYTLESEKGNAR